MKKKLYIIPLCLSALALASCGGKGLEGFNKLKDIVIKSEASLSAYNETTELTNSGSTLYKKNTSLELKRGEEIRTDVIITEDRLGDNGEGLKRTVSEYYTIGDMKYDKVDGQIFENTIVAPKYFLTFRVNEDYFMEGYTLEEASGKLTFEGELKEEMINAFLLDRAISGAKSFNVKLVCEDYKLISYEASYITKNNNDATIKTSYQYPFELDESGRDVIDAKFELEGGKVGDSDAALVFGYDFKGGKSSYIADPINIPDLKIEKTDHHIEGWYRTKTVENGKTVYSDKFDFQTEKMDRNGITLYAKWDKNVVYSFGVYINVNGKAEKITEKIVYKGEIFDPNKIDFAQKAYDLKLKEKLGAKTILSYVDEEGNPWDRNTPHPGGDKDTEIKIFVEAIDGTYTVVKTKSDLFRIKPDDNVYLTNDIDLKGSIFSLKEFNGEFIGNGHTISNGKIKFVANRQGLESDRFNPEKNERTYIYASIFNELGANAKIKDVSFINFTLNVKSYVNENKNIVIAPIAISGKNTVIENVRFIGKLTIEHTPKDCIVENILDKPFYKDENSTITNSSFSFEVIDERK